MDRCDGDVSYKEIRDVIMSMRKRGIPPLAKQSNSRVLYCVTIRDNDYYPVWSVTHDTIVTMLTKEMAMQKIEPIEE